MGQLMRNCAQKKAYEILALTSSQCATFKLVYPCVCNRTGRFYLGKVSLVMVWGVSTDPHTLVLNIQVVPFYLASFSISGVEPQPWFSGINMYF